MSTLEKHGAVRIRDRAWVIDRLLAEGQLLHEGRILWDKQRDRFHLVVRWRRQRPADPDPEGTSKRMVGLDPGERHFQTYYDPVTGEHGELLAYCHQRGADGTMIHRTAAERVRRAAELDKLRARLDAWQVHRPGRNGVRPRHMAYLHEQGILTDGAYRRYQRQHNHEARRQLVRRWKRAYAKVRAWRQDAHYEAANHLLSHWDVIVVSTARFGKMCERGVRVFGRQTARGILGWAHYEFRQRLRSAAFRYPGRIVVETTEDGTTGTCPRCGYFHSVGAAEVYECTGATCSDIRVDRDVNGARNNLLCAYTHAENWVRAALAGPPAAEQQP